MLFNSIDFAIFLPIVFGLYWFVFKSSIKLQNAFLLLASYVFYGWWDWRFLSLIVFSSSVDYLVGRALERTENSRKRKALLLCSICVNVGFLCFFKYYNFFAENFAEAFTLLGQNFSPSRLNIILPIGISFYTFQTMAYSIDVYRSKLKPTHDPLAFFAFVSFFPQLVAGPIERATQLLPQFLRKRKFEYHKAVDGMRQILWGLFKKMVVADNCAVFVDMVHTDMEQFSTVSLLLSAIFFAVQVYCDFSGYSDVAIGTARLFGFNLMQNFAFPLFSRDMAEFWRRWHISLSTWCKDYLYIPLGGNRKGKKRQMLNSVISYSILGFWHGANFTFLLFGFLHGMYYNLLLAVGNKKKEGIVAQGKLFPSVRESVQMLFTFTLFYLSLVIFRSSSVTAAFQYFSLILFPVQTEIFQKVPLESLGLAVFCLVIEWFQRDKQHALEINTKRVKPIVRYLIYGGLILMIAVFGVESREFVYFQF